MTNPLETLIPQPVSVVSRSGKFTLEPTTRFYFDAGNDRLKALGHYLAEILRPATGFELEVFPLSGSTSKTGVNLSLGDSDPKLGEEGYQLSITPEAVVLSAGGPAGVFQGIQTIRQLLPPEIEGATVKPGLWEIPGCEIKDHPRFEYRGAMLDVSRHFFGVADIKRYIDLLAYYKINHFHMHLSDDQGWRLEIKSWPNLAVHGGSTQVGGGPGGFYTQEEFAEIVAYAQSLYITIVPEIDLPGHTNAVLASYPELNQDGKAPELFTGINVGFSSLFIENENTFKFLEGVIREVAQLTPGPYIHIGGDEAHSTSEEDYRAFIDRIQKIVQANGKIMIGWDEVLKSNLDPGSIVQYWRYLIDEIEIPEGVKFIVSPANKSYLDMKYDESTALGLNWAGNIDVKDAYDWNPAIQVSGLLEENILGVEAPLWSETVETIADVEYMTFPRLAGVAEIGWSREEQRNWEDYRLRLAAHRSRLVAMGVNFYRSKLVDWE